MRRHIVKKGHVVGQAASERSAIRTLRKVATFHDRLTMLAIQRNRTELATLTAIKKENAKVLAFVRRRARHAA